MTITTQKTTETRWDKIRARVARFFVNVTTVFNFGLILLVLSLGSGIIGYRVVHNTPEPQQDTFWYTFWADYYANISAEFGSVAITVLIIDTLSRRRQKQEEKQRLIRQMSNKDNGIALQAVEELRALNALKDGTLRRINIEEANLSGVRLGRADLRQARMDFSSLDEGHLFFANLERADMSGVDLSSAVMTGANLRYANLVAADLRGALLTEVDLMHAKLDNAKFNENTRLPDNTNWTSESDLKRFTDPTNPNFWRSQMVESPAYDSKHRT